MMGLHSCDTKNNSHNKIMDVILTFINSKVFIAVPFILAFLSNAFAIEILVYFIIVALALFILFFNHDTKPIIPMFVAMYFGTSRGNSPHLTDNGIYQNPQTLSIVLALAGIAFLGFVARIFIYKEYKKFKLNNFKLLFGLLLFGISLCLGGIGSEKEIFKNVLFGLIEFFSIAFCYFYFINTIDWQKIDLSYICYVMLAMGLLMCLELGVIYLTADDIFRDGEIFKDNLFTGWGIQNNIGAMMVLSIPFCVYLATYKKFGFIYVFFTAIIFISCLFTLSRTSIFIGACVVLLGIIYCFIFSKGRQKIYNIITAILFISLAIVVLWTKFDAFYLLFKRMIEAGFGLTGREEIYKAGWETFLKNPIFGAGFYALPDEIGGYGVFIPVRYHNLVIQLLASCGVVGLLAFLSHFVQLTMVAFKKFSHIKMIMFFSILTLFALSMFDNHFFNFGPGIIYSIIICFLEGFSRKEEQLSQNDGVKNDKNVQKK